MNSKKAFIRSMALIIFLIMLIIFYKLNISVKLTPVIMTTILSLIVIGLFFNIAYLGNAIIGNVKENKVVNAIIDWVGFLALSIITILMVLTFVVSTSVVEGQSMSPTLKNGDHLFIYHFNYQPKRGDIVIIKREDDYLVKRVIALPGDYIEVKIYNLLSYTMHLNGATDPIKDGNGNTYYLDHTSHGLVLGINHLGATDLFILGDNGLTNNSSSDSKQHGFYDISNVVGKVIGK